MIGVNFSAMVQDIELPILMVNGELDKLNNKYLAAYSEVNANVDLRIIKGCGHLCSLENSDIFSDLLVQFMFGEN